MTHRKECVPIYCARWLGQHVSVRWDLKIPSSVRAKTNCASIDKCVLRLRHTGWGRTRMNRLSRGEESATPAAVVDVSAAAEHAKRTRKMRIYVKETTPVIFNGIVEDSDRRRESVFKSRVENFNFEELSITNGSLLETAVFNGSRSEM